MQKYLNKRTETYAEMKQRALLTSLTVVIVVLMSLGCGTSRRQQHPTEVIREKIRKEFKGRPQADLEWELFFLMRDIHLLERECGFSANTKGPRPPMPPFEENGDERAERVDQIRSLRALKANLQGELRKHLLRPAAP